ncbi:MAG: methylenetetrahydrofolate reductase [Dehalococcoidia bacterium]|nr:methylenetetrahydrofolate reductase [Dehalococcoidia bacterium]
MDALLKTPYVIELLTPKQSDEDVEARLEVFGGRYRRILDAGAVVSIPDNPMGNVHFTALEVVEFLDLPLDSDRTLLHLNSFHLRSDLESFLRGAADRGVKNLLVVSGDGGPKLPRLEPADVGIDAKTVTSIVLLRYIAREYPGVFTCGVAFNQYEPPEHELERLQWKIEAGAEFVITQPVLGEDPVIASLRQFGVPKFVGAWMSKRVDLLLECVGLEPRAEEQYEPAENLDRLDALYPDFGLYLALLSFKRDWSGLLTRKIPHVAGP